MAAFPARQFQRDDRYVQRCHVRGGGQLSRTRLQFCIEEALRLISLPGENEGRVYYFRRLIVKGLSPRANRQDWTAALREALLELSAHAIHGADPRAATADACLFHSRQEGLEVMLAKTIRADSLDAWFWPEVLGIGERPNRIETVLAIIQQLSEWPASWLAVADSILVSIGTNDPVALLSMLQPATAHAWLQEIAPRHVPVGCPQQVPLRASVAGMLLRSARALGSTDARVVWLASLAVMQAVPSDFSTGAAVSRAQAVLQGLLADQELRADSAPRNAIELADYTTEARSIVRPQAHWDALKLNRQPTRSRFRFIEEQGDTANFLGERHAANETSPLVTSSALVQQPHAEVPLEPERPETVATEMRLSAPHSFSESWQPADSAGGPLEFHSFSQGELTQAAGLYFLLNALTRLQITEVLARNSLLAERRLVLHVMRRLAIYAAVEGRDPAWHWINSTLSQVAAGDVPFQEGDELSPANVRIAPGKLVDIESLSRIWSVAVRRWCWRMGGITLEEVVNRPGRLSLNRTDLDVTLALSSAEIRIRRLGLDLDPGWLPWFGKVVRFHYVWDEGSNVW